MSVFESVVTFWENSKDREVCSENESDIAYILSILNKVDQICNENIEIYYNHLTEIQKDLAARFTDLFKINIHGWIINPFLDVALTIPHRLLRMS